LPFTLFLCLFYLSFVALEVLLLLRGGRGVVGSHGRVLHQEAEVLGEVRALDHAQALIDVQLAAPGEAGAPTHALELKPLLIPDLVLG